MVKKVGQFYLKMREVVGRTLLDTHMHAHAHTRHTILQIILYPWLLFPPNCPQVHPSPPKRFFYTEQLSAFSRLAQFQNIHWTVMSDICWKTRHQNTIVHPMIYICNQHFTFQLMNLITYQTVDLTLCASYWRICIVQSFRLPEMMGLWAHQLRKWWAHFQIHGSCPGLNICFHIWNLDNSKSIQDYSMK